MTGIIHIRLYEELNHYISEERKKKWFSIRTNPPIKIEELLRYLKIPPFKVDLILVNGTPVNFDYPLIGEEKVSIYPVFERLNISEVTVLREVPLRTPVFLCDSHLGKLSKYLRMLGFDALFVQNLPLLEIIKMGLDQKRIILSRNLKLIKHPRVTHAYLVKSYTPLEQIKDLVQALDLSGMIAPFTRCLLCTGLLEKRNK